VGVSARRLVWDLLCDKQKLASLDRGLLWSNAADWDFPVELRAGPNLSMPTGVQARECLYRLQGVLLEPHCGYAILPPGTVIDDSLHASDHTRHMRHMISFSGLPKLRDVHAVARGSIRPRKLARAVSFRHPYDLNYYHFTVDVATRLELLARFGVPDDVVHVISPVLFKQPFFQDVLRQPGFARRNWLVQDEFLEVEELYLARPLDGGTPEGLNYYREALGAPAPDRAQGERVFLDRSPTRGRAAANREQILPVIERAGFRVVDADGLSVLEQAELFSRCRVLAGLHGAGLTNMIFRGTAPLDVIEIFPPLETSVEYAVLARRLGYGYHHMRGTNPQASQRFANFTVDSERLGRLLETTSSAAVP